MYHINMDALLTAEDVGHYIQKMVSVLPIWKNINLSIIVIANPHAGFFTQKKRSKKARILFEEAINSVAKKDIVVKATTVSAHYTQYPRHASEITNDIITKIVATKESQRGNQTLIVSAGGDGTSLEIQTALLLAAQESQIKRDVVMNQCTVLRLPFGTGNDGTDGHVLDETLRMLESNVHFANARAIKVYYGGKPTRHDIEATGKAKDLWNASDAPWYAFNIASIGIDAFVTYMTNRMKSSMPGDSYQLWVDLAAAGYDTQFKPQEAYIEIINEAGDVTDSINTKIEFALLGVSGHRTYGSNHHILPDDNNVCIAPKMSLLAKLLKMNEFTKGTHAQKNLAKLFTAEKIRIAYSGTILVQMDGEARLLCPKHFPLVMERTEPCVRIIEQDDSPFDKGAVRKS